VNVTGDRRVEPRETFSVTLASPVNGTLAKATGVGTIVDDDGPRITAKGRSLRVDKQRTFSGVVASFADVDFATAGDVSAAGFAATVRWGDGTSSAGSITFNPSTGRWDVSGTHKYARKGRYTVSVLIADANRSTASATGSMIV
jgi:hypothetical protein